MFANISSNSTAADAVAVINTIRLGSTTANQSLNFSAQYNATASVKAVYKKVSSLIMSEGAGVCALALSSGYAAAAVFLLRGAGL